MICRLKKISDEDNLFGYDCIEILHESREQPGNYLCSAGYQYTDDMHLVMLNIDDILESTDGYTTNTNQGIDRREE